MVKGYKAWIGDVDCRIGSLENHHAAGLLSLLVDCRIGSLEISGQAKGLAAPVDCRIGSLEKAISGGKYRDGC